MQKPVSLLIAQFAFCESLRDRVLHMLLGAGFFVLLLAPAFSLFSMRQVQELAITLALSIISLFLMVSSVLLGASSIWRDIESRYTTSVLGLPISRTAFVLGKFFGTAFFLSLSGIMLGAASCVVIKLAAAQYPAQQPILWSIFVCAVFSSCCKYILLAAMALLFSAISTSFFLPIFGTIAIFLAGSASQEVMTYLSSDKAVQFSAVSKGVIKSLYYLLPNFSAFDLNVYAIYSLPLPLSGLTWTFTYFLVYTSIILFLAAWSFAKRELT